ncbi:NAD(P)-dependent oxidoreductase [Spirosoma utsteinense]|uniref:D-3-phosphoglycerate dehydrogenase n=1 Tax=Spirosoma utsteinense TaxID=2585773 RepID=A0ABR6W7U4_9BACT|nr:NAD(P)-dependent oxidoreductase [Spirosoma utsteinense]MBC3787742.1 D-3-phosphoglycerate dehydrogenase [Spirosoma utsteinense]MBC3792654.1 D-3-phosphoglycerate dehydrogenase [Spirosoma utsteinense]
MSQTLPAILIADEMHPSLFNLLSEAGFTYTYQPRITRAELIQQLEPYAGLIIRSKTTVDAELLSQAPNLRFIGRAGAGLDLIDLETTGRLGIRVFHAGEGNRDAVGEQAVGMLLALLTNLLRADREVRQGIWDREGNRGYELGSLTVGLIGYGNNGSATARRLSGFGCRALAYDKYLTNYGNQYAQEATLEQIQAEADVLSLHVPLTDDTRMLVNDEFIDQFAKPFYLMNVARGEIVALSAVVRGLESGKLRGACLDVLENEKLSKLTPAQQQAFDYLRQSDRVVLTPHIAGWTHESYIRINEVLIRQLTQG